MPGSAGHLSRKMPSTGNRPIAQQESPPSPLHNRVICAFKNVDEHSPILGEKLLALPNDLLGEARALWEKIQGV